MKPKKLIRAFFAFDIDENLRNVIAEIIENLKTRNHNGKIKWVPTQNLHVTLRFLGGIEPERITELTARIAAEIQAIHSFVIDIGRVMNFPPNSLHPRLVALTFPTSEALAVLVNTIEHEVNQCGFIPETRPFLPHLTLGWFRTKHVIDLNNLNLKLPEKLRVESVILYRSDQGDEGSIYTPIAETKLLFNSKL